jgi:hypothetical protein
MKNIALAVSMMILGACSSSPQDTGSTSSASTVLCSIPAGANTYGDGSVGCSAQPAEQDCTVTSGSTVFQDGAVENGTATCTSACPPHQFYLACIGPLGIGPAPSPDPSLNCTGTNGFTSSNESDFCCTCAP